MNWDKTTRTLNTGTVYGNLLTWSVATTKLLQRDFTTELTPKMIVNAIGILGRRNNQ